MSLQFNRKRFRSTECAFVGQSKQYINQQLMDKNDAEIMKSIHSIYPLKQLKKNNFLLNLIYGFSDKTVSLLFNGANKHYNENTAIDDHRTRFKPIRLHGDGKFSIISSGPNQVQALVFFLFCFFQ